MPRLNELSIDLAINLVSNVVFWLGLGLIVRLTALRKSRNKFLQFFGLQKPKLAVYLSNLWEPSSKTAPPGCILAGQEFKVAETVTSLFGSAPARLPESVRGLVDSCWFPDKVDFNIEVSPLPDCAGIDLHTSMIVVGTSVKNSVRRHYLNARLPWLKIEGEPLEAPETILGYHPLEPRVMVTKGDQVARQGQATPLEKIGCIPAVLEKLVDGSDQSVILMCIGYNGYCSWAAVEYLRHHWQELYHRFEDKPFARCLWFPATTSKGTSYYTEPIEIRDIPV
jgi:hypothetical protein